MFKGKLIAAAVAGILLAGAASASIVENVTLNFRSGATFNGTVTFANDFSSYTAVHGTLSGYKFGSQTYTSGATDSINWVWLQGTNFATGSNNYMNFLMDGSGLGMGQTGSNYTNFLEFGYHYSASGLTLFGGGLDTADSLSNYNNVDYTDPLVSGRIGVPEPATLTLLGVSLLGLAFARRRRAD